MASSCNPPTTPPRSRPPLLSSQSTPSPLRSPFKENLSPRSFPRPASPSSDVLSSPSQSPKRSGVQKPPPISSPLSRPRNYSAASESAISRSGINSTSTSRSRSNSTQPPSRLLPAPALSTHKLKPSKNALASFHPFASDPNSPTFSDMDAKSIQRPFARIRGHASSSSLRAAAAMDEHMASPRSSEETLTDQIFDDNNNAGFRQRARNWARSPAPSFRGKGKEPAGEPEKDPFAGIDDGSSTEVDEDEEFEHELGSGSEGSSAPTLKWTPSGVFKVQDPVTRHGSRQAAQSAAELPYPICYDKVLSESDDHTYDLVKTLIPNRSGLTFHDFQKPPVSVLDLGCGEGRWVLEAALQWKHTRFAGLDVQDLQPELSGKFFDDVRDRVQWVHSNFLHYRLPFDACNFDFVRMSHIGLAVSEDKWKGLLYEVRRVLKPGGVIEWIDEDVVFPLSPDYSPDAETRLTQAKGLEAEFRSLIRSRHLANPLRTVSKLLKGRALGMIHHDASRYRLALPGPPTEDVPRSSTPTPKVVGFTGLKHGATSSKRTEKDLPALPKPCHVPFGFTILADNKLLPLSHGDIEAHATRNYQLLLGSAEAIWAQRLAKGVQGSREEFDKAIWDYECGRYARLHLPSRMASSWEDSDDEGSSPVSSIVSPFSANVQRRRSPLASTASSTGEEPVVVRNIFVVCSISA